MAKFLQLFLYLFVILIVSKQFVETIYLPETSIGLFDEELDALELNPDFNNKNHYYVVPANTPAEAEDDASSQHDENSYTTYPASLKNVQHVNTEHNNKLPHISYDNIDDVVDVPKSNRHHHHHQQQAMNMLGAQPALHAYKWEDATEAADEETAHNNNNEFEEDEQESEEDSESSSHTISRKRRELTDWLIAPNTRWCGRGNTANNTYNVLGGASAADKCCRKHDHCKMYIPAMSNRFELFNYRPYTLSHCNCDSRFRTCLKLAGDEDANTIGKLFFNMVQTQCFYLIKEHICEERSADGSCARERVKQKANLRNNKKY